MLQLVKTMLQPVKTMLQPVLVQKLLQYSPENGFVKNQIDAKMGHEYM